MSAPLKQLGQEPTQDQRRRFCPRCEALLPISEFGINRARSDGLNLYCKTHARALVYDYRRQKPGYQAERAKRSRAVKQIRAKLGAEPAPPPSSLMDRVWEYLEQQGEATQTQLSEALEQPLAQIDVALAELQLTQRKIGARALNPDTRIYFCL